MLATQVSFQIRPPLLIEQRPITITRLLNIRPAFGLSPEERRGPTMSAWYLYWESMEPSEFHPTTVVVVVIPVASEILVHFPHNFKHVAFPISAHERRVSVKLYGRYTHCWITVSRLL